MTKYVLYVDYFGGEWEAIAIASFFNGDKARATAENIMQNDDSVIAWVREEETNS